jgi:cell division septal protein FtsQ
MVTAIVVAFVWLAILTLWVARTIRTIKLVGKEAKTFLDEVIDETLAEMLKKAEPPKKKRGRPRKK